MPRPKTNYTELVHQIVRDSQEPLGFDEIFRRVGQLAPVTTKNPKGTVRSAITQSNLIVPLGDGTYGWKYRVITGSVLRLSLYPADLQGGRIEFNAELIEALFPAFFGSGKRQDRAPIQLILPNDERTVMSLEMLGPIIWGTRGTVEFWSWLKPLKPQVGDALIFRVLNGDAREYTVEFELRSQRDEAVIAERNDELMQRVEAFLERNPRGTLPSRIVSQLMGQGFYKHPVPPDGFEELWAQRGGVSAPGKAQVRSRTVFIGAGIEITTDETVEDFLLGLALRPAKTKHQPAAQERGTPTDLVYQLKVTLKGSHPPIWRRLQVRGDIPLSRLHRVLQIAMGWTDSHMHQFRVGARYYGVPDREFGDSETLDERRFQLIQIAQTDKARFIYEYDFGDSWEHDIAIEKIFKPDGALQHPMCLAGKRACPPEDVGGVWGYERFLQVIQDPDDPEHEDLLEWIGGEFDPEAFDLEGVNALLKRVK